MALHCMNHQPDSSRIATHSVCLIVCLIRIACAGLVEREYDLSDMPDMFLKGYLLWKAGILTPAHVLWQAFESSVDAALGEYDPSRDLKTKYNNLTEFLMSMRFHGGAASVHLMNGIGGTGLGRGARLTASQHFRRHNLTCISLRTLTERQPVPELRGGISKTELLRYIECCKVGVTLS